MLIEIPGKPMGKQRPRLSKWGTYTPKETVQYEKLIKNICKDMKPLHGMIRVQIQALFMPPSSLSNKKKNALIGQFHVNKPDADNIAKIVLDGMNGAMYEDDKQVVELSIQKRYAEEDKVIIEIEEV